MNGRNITDLGFDDNFDGFSGYEEELVSLSKTISLTASKFVMEINQTKTKLLINDNTCNPRITIHNEQIEIVNHYKYLGSFIYEQGSKTNPS